MIALSSQTATAIALHARDGAWVMFVQAVVPPLLPIRIEAVHGRDLIARLAALADNFCETQLIGLLESQAPEEDAEYIANEFAAYQIKGWWFESHPSLLTFIQTDAQSVLPELLARTRPGGLSDAPVDIEDIAKVLGVSVPTVRRMVKAGEIPFLKFGRQYRFVPADVLASLRQQ